jgi:hypothetical protein
MKSPNYVTTPSLGSICDKVSNLFLHGWKKVMCPSKCQRKLVPKKRKGQLDLLELLWWFRKIVVGPSRPKKQENKKGQKCIWFIPYMVKESGSIDIKVVKDNKIHLIYT